MPGSVGDWAHQQLQQRCQARLLNPHLLSEVDDKSELRARFSAVDPRSQSISDAPARQVVRRQFGAHAVTWGDLDPEPPHLATGLADGFLLGAIDTNAVAPGSERLQDQAFDFDCFLFG